MWRMLPFKEVFINVEERLSLEEENDGTSEGS